LLPTIQGGKIQSIKEGGKTHQTRRSTQKITLSKAVYYFEFQYKKMEDARNYAITK